MINEKSRCEKDAAPGNCVHAVGASSLRLRTHITSIAWLPEGIFQWRTENILSQSRR